MLPQDTCCTIVPYLQVPPENMAAFGALCQRAIEKAQQEKGYLYYGFSFDGNLAHCREGYADARALLEHLANMEEVLKEMLSVSELTRLEVHGPAPELAKLREPLAALNPQFFTLEFGFRR
ncbi:MAG: hypothetical protein BECKG1743F_GA0114225_105061 [Candidatus Kentron sp. G]|nr:MAG: hypothetical protein BECKG1743F_GA0114225_105061 [Candidatus Kentron sp. G]